MPTEPVSIDGLTFDALIESDESWDADVPVFPVETGFEVSDSVILRPIKLNMRLYLTNTPVTWRKLHGNSPHRVQEVLECLRQIYLRKEAITVKTNEADYVNMAIVSISLPKNIEVGEAREIPISFQQIRTVEAATTTIPANLGRGGGTGTNAGTANTNVSPTPATSSSGGDEDGGNRGSILFNLAGSVGLLGR